MAARHTHVQGVSYKYNSYKEICHSFSKWLAITSNGTQFATRTITTNALVWVPSDKVKFNYSNSNITVRNSLSDLKQPDNKQRNSFIFHGNTICTIYSIIAIK